MAHATPADVEARLGRDLNEDEALIVGARLSDAEIIIKSRIPDLVDQVAAGTVRRDVVVMVESDMVLRLVRNPDGFVQESDGNYSYMLSQQVASGRLEVLDHEWALLGVRSSMFVIVPDLPIYEDMPSWLTPYSVRRAVEDGWA